MKIQTRKIYYCDFCHKHKHFSGIMAEHEKHCTANPNRECRMCGEVGINKEYVRKLRTAYKTLMSHKGKDGASDMGITGTYVHNFNKRVNEIYKSLGCPACMLAILRQNKSSWTFDWNYQEELKKYWEIENDKAERDAEYEAIYG